MKKIIKTWLYIAFLSLIIVSSTHALRFAVISDTRAGSLDKALEFIQSQAAEFIILPGDFYYDEQDYYSHFVKFGFEVKPEVGPDQQNLYIALGNHDAPPTGDEVFINQIAPYYPKNGPLLSPEGTVFSFDRGNCHFVITNQYWDYPAGGYCEEQLEWIDQDLFASTQPFKFVVGHEPAFPFHRHTKGSLNIDPDMRDAFWHILEENKVSAFFCGHTHHLSHIKKDGVYQIDNGEVRSDHLCVTLVDVENDRVSIRSYKTSGNVPVAETNLPDDNDLVAGSYNLDTSIVPGDGFEYIYGAAPADDSVSEDGSDGLFSGCFIGCVTCSEK